MKNLFLILTIILGTQLNAQKFSFTIFQQGKQERFFVKSQGKVIIKSKSVDEYGIHKGRIIFKTDSITIRSKVWFVQTPTEISYFFDISPTRRKYKKFRIISLDNLFGVYKNDELVSFYDTKFRPL
jgi:hypothetical protein